MQWLTLGGVKGLSRSASAELDLSRNWVTEGLEKPLQVLWVWDCAGCETESLMVTTSKIECSSC